MVDIIISVTLKLINPQHLKNWFAGAVSLAHSNGKRCITTYTGLPRYFFSHQMSKYHYGLPNKKISYSTESKGVGSRE